MESKNKQKYVEALEICETQKAKLGNLMVHKLLTRKTSNSDMLKEDFIMELEQIKAKYDSYQRVEDLLMSENPANSEEVVEETTAQEAETEVAAEETAAKSVRKSTARSKKEVKENE